MTDEPTQKEISKIERNLRRQRIMTWFGTWSGFRGKTLWDWMGLIISAMIPLVLLLFGQSYSESQRVSNLEIEQDRQREVALQKYFDDMAELMLDRNLLTSKSDDEVRSIARTRTLTVLRGLDGERKGLLLRFLYESELIGRYNPIMNEKTGELENTERIILLEGADLKNAILRGVALQGAFLSMVDFSGADLQDAGLYSANLQFVNFRDANLQGASLQETILIALQLQYFNNRGRLSEEA